MAVLSFSHNDSTCPIDCSAERGDPVAVFFFRKDCLPEPALQVAGNQLYQQEKLVAFIVNLAVFTECKAGFDLIYRRFNRTPFVVVIKYFGGGHIFDVYNNSLIFVSALIEYQLAIPCSFGESLTHNDNTPCLFPSGHRQKNISSMENSMFLATAVCLFPFIVLWMFADSVHNLFMFLVILP